MSLIAAHLQQIGHCCQGIDSLPFPPSKIFTNALLGNDDITSLIRDTESHERALFSVPPPPPPASTALKAPSDPSATGIAAAAAAGENAGEKTRSGRRQTVFNVSSGEVTTGAPNRVGGGNAGAGGGSMAHPARHTAVAAVLGGEMHEQLRRGASGRAGGGGGDVDVEVLLRGAEKLCGVYELPGARDRIATLRSKYRNGKNTMAYYEAKVAEQAEQLASMNRDWMHDDDEDDDGQEGEGEQADGGEESEVWTEEDLRREEGEAREMEAKKRELQARLRAMQKDLGGLMNM